MAASGGMLLTVVTLLAGWACMWPLRPTLGWGYHIAAYPVGLVLWPLAAAVLSPFGSPFDSGAVLAGYVALAAVVWLLARSIGGSLPPAQGQVPAWTYLAWGTLLVAASAIVSLTRWTSAAYDSVFHYEAWGQWLHQTGTVSVQIIGDYGIFIPTIHAVDTLLGAGWTSVPYPLLSLHVLAVVLAATYGWARPRLGPPFSRLLAVGTVVFLAATTPYLHHTLYVHSHMITAAYLVLAIWCIQRAYLGAADDADLPGSGHASMSWLFVAGLASAGFALTRTDGIAYVIVPIIVAALLRLETGGSRPAYVLFLATVAVPVIVVYGSALLDLGVWDGRKLTGSRAIITLCVLTLAGVATVAVDAVPRVRRLLAEQRRGLFLVVAANILALLGLAAMRPDGFAEAGRNMLINLFSTGGYRLLWFVILGIILIPFLWRYRWSPARWPVYLLYTIGQFFVVAVLVHGVAHPGRLSPADSFTRVAFHVVPLAFWYAGIVGTTLVQAVRRSPST